MKTTTAICQNNSWAWSRKSPCFKAFSTNTAGVVFLNCDTKTLIKTLLRLSGVLLFCILLESFTLHTAYAQSLTPLPSVDINIGAAESPQQVSSTLQLVFLISIIALAPTLLIMLTSFTRIIISLHFLRSALSTQQMPPNQVLVGIALFLTLFVMSPVFDQINEHALKPYAEGKITQEQAMEVGMRPLRDFMFRQVEAKDMTLFINLSGQTYASQEEIPSRVLIPAFMLGEVTKGFQIGFMIYLPFIAIDMVVASTLMAMGMMMLPPAMISLPFKILFFILADGWSLVMESVVRTFR